jgi:hypothetical protein
MSAQADKLEQLADVQKQKRPSGQKMPDNKS